MANRSILTAIFLMLFILGNGLPASAKTHPTLQTIPSIYREIAAEARVPAAFLYSLALVESSRRFKGGERPWPWTINVAGKGYRYETREEAWHALLRFVRQAPLKRIDVGIAQVNFVLTWALPKSIWVGMAIFSLLFMMFLTLTPICVSLRRSFVPAMKTARVAG